MDQQAPAETPCAQACLGLRPALGDLAWIVAFMATGGIGSRWLQDGGVCFMVGAVLGFVATGLRAEPGRLFRRVAKAFGAFACALMAAGFVHLLWLAYGSARSDYVFGKDIDWGEALVGYGMAGPFFMAMHAVNLLPFALLGGGLAWLIRRWRPAKVPCES